MISTLASSSKARTGRLLSSTSKVPTLSTSNSGTASPLAGRLILLRDGEVCFVAQQQDDTPNPLRYTWRPEQADVAQQVEQLTRNEQVSGSSPLVGSLFSLYLSRIVRAGKSRSG